MSAYEFAEWSEYFQIRAERLTEKPKPQSKYQIGR